MSFPKSANYSIATENLSILASAIVAKAKEDESTGAQIMTTPPGPVVIDLTNDEDDNENPWMASFVPTLVPDITTKHKKRRRCRNGTHTVHVLKP